MTIQDIITQAHELLELLEAIKECGNNVPPTLRKLAAERAAVVAAHLQDSPVPVATPAVPVEQVEITTPPSAPLQEEQPPVVAVEPEPVVEPTPALPVEEERVAEEPLSATTHTPEIIGESIPAAAALPLDQAIQRHIAKDIRKALSLNDRFRFRRELFAGSNEALSEALEQLNQCNTLEEALSWVETTQQWDFEDEHVLSFIDLIEKRFS